MQVHTGINTSYMQVHTGINISYMQVHTGINNQLCRLPAYNTLLDAKLGNNTIQRITHDQLLLFIFPTWSTWRQAASETLLGSAASSP